jgi:uncharacterized protein with HEPN domain
MPSREWQLRVQDILNSAIAIQNRTQGYTYEQFCDDETVSKATLYDFMIIGEATIYIPSTLKEKYPDIPWRMMADMRNVMAYEYFQIRLRTVWEGVEMDIPLLIEQLNELIKHENL